MGPRPASHRSKSGLALGAGVLLAAACHKDPTVTTRTVTAYVPAACAVDGGGYAEYYALGDFDPAPPQTGHFLDETGVELPEVYASTRALVVTAGEGGRNWEGVAPVAESGDVAVLVLPELASCPLSANVGGPRTGSTLATIAGERMLVVGGKGNVVPTTFVVRLDTGAVAPVQHDTRTPRTDASVTAFGDGALVAGGTDVSGSVLDTFEIYSAATGGFDQQDLRHLSEPRAQHGAVVLGSGATLLVGGVGGPDGQTVLGTMETVDPATLLVQEQGLAELQMPRRQPSVLRLASGEILVAGGFQADGTPADLLEWFEPDGTPSKSKKPVTLAQGAQRAFIALQGGGALAVLTPPAGTSPQGFQNTWVIDASGAPVAASVVQGALADPVLFGGAGGAPVLWTGDRWLQWDPYQGAFGLLPVLDTTPAAVGPTRTSPDGGLALWIDQTQQALVLLRFDTRNAYSSLPGPLLVENTDQTAPDRFGDVRWSPSDGGLVLGVGAPGGAAFVTDRTYADVAIDVEAPTGEPAFVELRDPAGNAFDIGQSDCLGAVAPGAASKLHVERRGQAITWSVVDTGGTGSGDGSSTGSCTLDALDPTARVSVGVRGAGSTRSVVRNLVVTRLGVP